MKKFNLLAFLFSVFVIFGCVPKEEAEVEYVESSIIASGQSLPEHFEEFATERNHEKLMAVRAKNEQDYEEVWKAFQITEELSRIDMEEKDVLFMGLFESSSCPYTISNVVAHPEKQQLEVSITSKGGDCTADHSPRNFVLALDQQTSAELSTLILHLNAETISLPITDK